MTASPALCIEPLAHLLLPIQLFRMWLLWIRRTREAKRDTKSDSCFFHFRLLQLCLGKFFAQYIPVYCKYPSSGLVNILSLSCRACEMQWQVQSCSSCGQGVRVQKRGKDSGKSTLFLEEIRISDLLASVASRLQSSFSLQTMVCGEGIRAWEGNALRRLQICDSRFPILPEKAFIFNYYFIGDIN